MSTKHTPGPWKTKGDPYVSTHDCKQSIAFTDARGISSDEAKANARLIAAAPELLEALKSARLHISGEALPTKAQAIAQIDAAIAKAEGGEA